MALRCMAPHPGRERDPRFAGRTHGIRLPAVIPDEVRFVRLLDDLDEVRPGNYAVLCPHRDCRRVHEYERVPSDPSKAA